MVLGFINIMGSFLSALPTSAEFHRTAVNIGSGVRSPFSGVITPIAVGVALHYWGHSFYYIPKPILAGVIIAYMYPLIDTQMPQDLWRTKSNLLIIRAPFFYHLFIQYSLFQKSISSQCWSLL